MDNSLYRQLVRSLLYITHSKQDLEYAVGGVSRYMNKPHDIQLKESKSILHYMQGTRHFRVHYAVGSPLELVGYYDSDWDGDPNDRNYTSGYVFMISCGPICW